MNFVAHLHVGLVAAAGARDADDIAFGAALPDLTAMARMRAGRGELAPSVAVGVAIHHASDAAFHSLPAFTAGARAIREQLTLAGVALGPARAVGHAGWELLLDGCLLERAGLDGDVVRVLGGAPDVAAAVSPEDPERWRRLMGRLLAERWWRGYRDPSDVARRLERLLRERRRLSFPPVELGAVTEALADARPAVERASAEVVAAVIAAVGAAMPD